MAKQKTYTITLGTPFVLRVFLRELKMWEVKDTTYTVNELVVTTKSTNVVDVCTETFRQWPEVYAIDVVEQ